LGADFCFDYKDKNVTKKIQETIPSGKQLKHALDCVGVDIAPIEAAVVEGGSICLVLPPTKQSPNHHVEMVVAGVIHDLDNFDSPGFKFVDGKEPRDSQGGRTLNQLMKWTLSEAGKKYQVPKVRKMSGKGMYDAFEAFEAMKSNQISGEKVVWRMADTPGLSDR
jgi:hypothetical protein